MPPPLSPLTLSYQNSRSFSPSPGRFTAGKGGIGKHLMAMDDLKNVPSTPKKLGGDDDTSAGNQNDLSYAASHESQNLDDEEYEPLQQATSSPFQEDGRDCTVDFQMFRKRQPSPGVSERSSTPRKRSFGDGPEDQDIGEDLHERYRKGVNRMDVPDIDVYTDEGAGSNTERTTSEGAEQRIANSIMEETHNEGMSNVLHRNDDDIISTEKENERLQNADNSIVDDSHDLMDDTCLSTFSAVPNVDMTSFAKLRGDSPWKVARPLPDTPSQVDDAENQRFDPSTPITARVSPKRSALTAARSPVCSPTPKRRDLREDDNFAETPNLLDLTDQPTFPRKRYNIQNERYSPSRRSPLRAVRESIRSPQKVSLLDFDIPAAPTPRSIPTVTPRELESLKSGFLSEISSLKATLSGKDAEVSSLKQAVADAERRVGEALEEVRNEAARKEALEVEQIEWQRRGEEMNNILRSVKAQIGEGERERDQLTKRVEETEKHKEQLEGRLVELETQLSAARNSASGENRAPEGCPHMKTAEETANEVQDAVEKVARELHTLYKSKHEIKVAALKKSYEARWEKRVREAEDKLKAVNEENGLLRTERDTALSAAPRPDSSIIVNESDKHEAEKRVLEAQVKGLQQEMAALRDDSERLRKELRMERTEKGELVAAVDEWLTIQSNQPPSQSPKLQGDEQSEPVSENLGRSIGRGSSSGIRPPSTGSGNGEKKIPKIGAPGNRHVRGNSGGKSGIAVFTPGRSGIMGSIERMGRGGI
ncbi:uncharacterized protein ATNIH1004_011146 [Aspergillus tanneri]|uniref:Uncharacterized protein n=1 Tax=Aspergillus tanneri TaxID=1220188 RepID=A0A5M9M5A8_9EURO|nr:uncharacterized protein ATNIH1004_011146 [Aspergillus tanneri]KAA8642205.1 hypothetical protein ATNIH1004_011146 [Aspergillus tanneri]